jgi:hypothetical protein
MTRKQTKFEGLFTDWILSVFAKITRGGRRSQSIIAYKHLVLQGKGLPAVDIFEKVNGTWKRSISG